MTSRVGPSVFGVIAATLLLSLVAAPRPASAQSQIRAVVNGDPVTTNEIANRARLLRLVDRRIGADAATQRATQEMIEEKLKLQEAKRLQFTATDQQVDAAFADIATRVKLQPAQLAQALRQSGVDPNTLRQRLRTQIVWQQAVVTRFRRSVSISDTEVVQALAREQQKKPDGKSGPGTVAEYTLQQVTFVVPGAARAAQLPARKREAEAFRAKITSCEMLLPEAKALREVVVKNVGKRVEDELPETFKGALAEVPVGRLTKPIETPLGLELLAVCDKRDIQIDNVNRTKVENELREQEGMLLQRQYLNELRQRAVIEYKK